MLGRFLVMKIKNITTSDRKIYARPVFDLRELDASQYIQESWLRIDHVLIKKLLYETTKPKEAMDVLRSQFSVFEERLFL